MMSPQGTLAVPAADPQTVEALAAFGRFASARGWVPATGGNFSHRIDAAHALVTRSGIDKGDDRRGRRDRRADRRPDPGRNVGGDAAAPRALSRLAAMPAPSCTCTPSRLPCSRARISALGHVRFTGFEMQKALRGISTHEDVVDLPVFANDQDTDGARRSDRSNASAPTARAGISARRTRTLCVGRDDGRRATPPRRLGILAGLYAGRTENAPMTTTQPHSPRS